MDAPHRRAPDAETIEWCFGFADEERVKDTIRSDVRNRATGLSPDSDEYWRVVAEVAIEAVLYDLAEQARRGIGAMPGEGASPEPFG